MSTERNKTYLGDGAYATFNGFDVQVTAENGITVTDRVVLEPQVLEAFVRWLPGIYDKDRLIALIEGDYP